MGVAEGLQGDPQLHAALAVDVDELVVLQPDDVAVVDFWAFRLTSVLHFG